MFGSTSYLNWSDEVVESAVGVQQGDPLAPVLFCMVLIVGPAEEVIRALGVIEQVGSKLGLFTNLSKKDGGVFCTDEIILDTFQ
jgi:hypothetical protein